MKNKLLLLAFLLMTFGFMDAQTARIMAIHNSADPAANVVDVYVNNSPFIENFTFRTSSGFVDAPAGVPLTLSVIPDGLNDTSQAVFTATVTLMSNSTYVIIASGNVGTGFSTNEPFDLYIEPMGREQSSTSGNTDLLVFHGSTDAPTVDVVEVAQGAGTLVNDLDYGTFAGYLSVPAQDYSIQVRDQWGESTVVQYSAPLNTLGMGDSALVVFASGYLDPSQNNNGPSFGLFVSTASGNVIPLPTENISTARAQIIHNCADALASSVDIWVNSTRAVSGLNYKEATPFVDLPAGTSFDVSITGPGATDTSAAVFKQTYTLMGGETYLIVADGIIDNTNYIPAPAFDLEVFAGATERASNSGETDVVVHHGSTDAPEVDVDETTLPVSGLVTDLMYTDFEALNLPTGDYELLLKRSADNSAIITYGAPLSTLGLTDSSIVVIASGFLNPANNNNGPDFGLFAILANGGAFIPLPVASGIGITENIKDLGFKVFPVPADDILQIENGEGLNVEQFRVMDISGQEVLRTESTHQAIDISNLRSGVYFLEVRTEQGIQFIKWMKN